MTDFVSRETWGHPDPSDPGGNYVGVIRQPYLVEHHTPGETPNSYDECLEELAQIYHSHTVVNGWQDIGYNFLIWDRYVFEGRGFGYTGAHAPGANSISLGIAFILDGRERAPSQIERQSYQWLVGQAQTYGYLSLNPRQTGHRDWVATTCPGDLPYGQMPLLSVSVLDPTPGPTPLPTPSEEINVYDFDRRPGGVFGWHEAHIDYTNMGGACAYDFPNCAKDEVIAVSGLTPDLGDLVCSVVYPSGKQSQAGAAKWGHPMKFAVEEAGFVTVLVEARGIDKVRVVGRSS
jgi:hypothetical protein